jgi:hypothetical protein
MAFAVTSYYGNDGTKFSKSYKRFIAGEIDSRDATELVLAHELVLEELPC